MQPSKKITIPSGFLGKKKRGEQIETNLYEWWRICWVDSIHSDQLFPYHQSEIMGQFHQPNGIKRKCAGSYYSVPIGAVQFHQQKYAQLYMHGHKIRSTCRAIL